MQDFENNGRGILVPKQAVQVKGHYSGQIIREGKIIDEFEVDNLVVNEGLNHILGVEFNALTPVTSWYLGVYEGNHTPVATDTAAGIAAAATESTAYASSTRPQWVQASPSGQAISNSASRASFVFNATKTIYGAFLISSSTKSGTAGVLFSCALFNAAKNVVNLDELLLTYTFTASSV
jgi:hypothetical protein